jgi:hypothetical protein
MAFRTPDFKQLIKVLPSSLDLLSPLLLVAALTSMYVAGASVASVVGTITSEMKSQAIVKSVQLKRDSIGPDQALRSAQMISRLSPTMKVEVVGSQVHISSQSLENYASFVHALTVLQSSAPDVAWETIDMCLGTCNGAVISAKVTGTRQHIEYKR